MAGCWLARGLLSSACALPLVPLGAQADESMGDPPLAIELKEMTVTAKGYASETLETPIATTVVEREAIRKRNADTLGELLRGRPGLAASGDGAQGQNPVVRGLKKESLVLLVDGMRLNSAQPAGAIGSLMSLGLAERVEVVKGPASVLYGTGALGGAINVLLPQARFEPGLGADVASSYDSASNGVRGTAVMRGSEGDHALMLGTSLASFGDYESPDGRVDRTGYDSDSFIGQYRYRLDGAQQVRLSLQQHTDWDVCYPGSTKPHANPRVGSTTVHSPKTRRRLAELGYSRAGGGERPVNLDLRLYRQTMYREIYSRANGALDKDIGETSVTFATNGLDLRADWLVHDQHLLSFGVNAWEMTASPERYLARPPSFDLVRNDPFDDARIRALGLYVQDDIRLGALSLLAGVRHDTVSGDADSIGNGARTSGLGRTDSAFSGSLGAIYEVAPLLRPYVSLSRAFRAGEMRERYESSPRGDGYYYVGNPQIEPEYANQVEIGLKGADDRLSYAISAYYNRITDYITGKDVSGPAGSNVCPAARASACKETVNLGRVTLKGLEAEARWEALPGQWLSAGWSMVRGENEDLDEPLYQMPADELTLGWEGRVAKGWTADLSLRLVQDQDRVATRFTNGSEDPTPGFTTADIGATYRWKRHSLRFAVTNLADEAYHEHLTEGISGQEIEAPGRSFVVSYQGGF